MSAYKPTGALKNFIEATKKTSRVVSAVERHVLSQPRDTSRRTNVLHPSEMVDPSWCYRASYFHLKGEVPAPRNFKFQTLSVFEEGHSIHAKWQGWLADMGNLYGLWECKDCGKRGYGLSSDLSAVCGTDDCYSGFDYREVPLDYKPLRISGHSDGWLVGLGDPLMLEIKSVGVGTLRYEASELLKLHDNNFDKAWKALKEPFMKHIMQVQVYMKLAELLEYPDVPQEAVLIYENKSNQDSKEFIVHKSDFGITQLFDAAKLINDAVDANTPLPCNITANGCAKCEGYTDESN